MWGVALIALGLLAGLGIYADMAGPLGGGLADAFGALVGGLRVLAPIGLVVGGALLLRGPRQGDDPAAHHTVRLVVGTGLIVVAVAGLLHLLRGRPESGAPLDDIVHAGGYLGIAVGGPLEEPARARGVPASCSSPSPWSAWSWPPASRCAPRPRRPPTA